MNVLFLSPAFPAELPRFCVALAEAGAAVYGVGEQPVATLPESARRALTAYLQVPSIWDEAAVVSAVKRECDEHDLRIHKVESLWEPLMILAAKLREALGASGMTVAQTRPFRDKEVMKHVLDEAGIRTPRHAGCQGAEAIREAAERIGYPLIVKPIAGAGSADTHRVDDAEQLERVIALTAHVPELSVEEFIEGEEFTFDTICAGGEVLFHNISWYRPRPLIQRTVEWVAAQTIALRNPEDAYLASGRAMGFAVLEALGFQEGYTHMEWFRTASGEAVFGEIGARPAGARSVDIMSYAAGIDCYRAWAEAICHGRLGAPIARRHNAAIIFKRAVGQGRIQAVRGLESLLARFGEHVVSVDLLPVGAQRRNWKATLLSDGHLIVCHPDLQSCLGMADAVGTDIQIVAGG